MEHLILKSLEGQGIWTIVAVCLTIYVLKTSGERENKLHGIIEKLTDKFNIVEDIQKDVTDIKNRID